MRRPTNAIYRWRVTAEPFHPFMHHRLARKATVSIGSTILNEQRHLTFTAWQTQTRFGIVTNQQ